MNRKIFAAIALFAACFTVLGQVQLTNLDQKSFTVDITAAPTNIVNLHLRSGQFSPSATGWVLTNIAGIPGGSTNITTNSVWLLNGSGHIVPAVTNSAVIGTNIVREGNGVMGGTEVWFTKTITLTNGVNYLPSGQYSQLQLLSPSTDPSLVQIVLSNGVQSIQHLEIFNLTNSVPSQGGFTLTNLTPIPDNPGGFIKLINGENWVATNGCGIELRYMSPDWVEQFRSDVSGNPTFITNTFNNIVVNSNITLRGNASLTINNITITTNDLFHTNEISGTATLQPVNLGLAPLVNLPLLVGTSTPAIWTAGYQTNGTSFASIRNTANGDPNLNQIFIATAQLPSTRATNAGYFNAYSQTNQGVMIAGYKDSSGQENRVTSGGQIGSPLGIAVTTAGVQDNWLFPNQPDGTAVFKVNSTLTHSLGNLAEIFNNGTTNFSLKSNSGYTGTGTNVLLDNGTFGVVPGAGANMTNTGAAVVGMVPVAKDTSGGSWTPTNAVNLSAATVAGASVQTVGTIQYSPPQKPNLQLWIAPESPLNATAGLVNQWNDISGQKHHGTATLTVRPTVVTNFMGNYRAVTFDASNDLLDFGNFMAGASSFTIIMVAQKATNLTLGLGFSKQGAFNAAHTNDEWVVRLGESANNLATVQLQDSVFNAYVTNMVGSPSSNLVINCISWTNSTTPTMEINGFGLTPTSTGWQTNTVCQTTTNTVKLGYVPGFFNPSGGTVAEVLLWNTQLSTSERTDVNRYLSLKYWQNNLVVNGDSLSSGKTSGTTNTNYRPWPYQVQQHSSRQWRISNFSYDGATTTALAAADPTGVDTMWLYGKRNVAVLWEITNQIAFGTGSGAAYTNYVNWCNGRRANGYYVVATTVLPRGDAGIDVDFETKRFQVNTNIVATWTQFADALADVAANTNIGCATCYTNTTYYLYDLVHLNNTGADVAAGIFGPAIDSIP